MLRYFFLLLLRDRAKQIRMVSQLPRQAEIMADCYHEESSAV